MIKIIDYATPEYVLEYLKQKYSPAFLYKFHINKRFKKLMNKPLNINSPKSLSEKIQWIKLNDITESKKTLSDKLLSKKYAIEKIPELKSAKIYQIGNSFNDIDFSTLPQSFILKTNHSWGTNITVSDKSSLSKDDYKRMKKFYSKMLRINFAYCSYYELQYKDIKPKIYVEELLNSNCNNYEVWCFNEKPEFITFNEMKHDEESGFTYCEQYCLDTNWDQADFNIRFKNTGKEQLSLCSQKDKILKYSSELSKGFDFVRVDFMEVNNEIYFCEMTFTPYSGFIQFIPADFDLYFGEKLNLKIEN